MFLNTTASKSRDELQHKILRGRDFRLFVAQPGAIPTACYVARSQVMFYRYTCCYTTVERL